jgi:phenylpropionate dioxygenase-like ring-hydroxylating dioxygenase large terminal subunit
MSWYVVAETKNIKKNEPYKIIVWNKPYVIWKMENGEFSALEDICPHRGASLSAGKLAVDRIICPYHGYEFNHAGNLTIVPGMCFQPSSYQNCARFPITERHGWIYLNTNQIPWFATQPQLDILNKEIFIEPEATDKTMSVVLVNTQFNTFARVVSENSLDIMHIAFVHTFGNRDKPAPSYDDPPKQITNGHWRTSYVYESGKHSMVHTVFHVKKIDIDNEFALPHTTIARVKFGDGLINTIVTAACPINHTTTQLFVKTYRNFLHGFWEDKLFAKMMMHTLNEDKSIIETITIENMEGKFNMKYDKLQNTYKTLYKQYIKHIHY